jgi:hypothetical protein
MLDCSSAIIPAGHRISSCFYYGTASERSPFTQTRGKEVDATSGNAGKPKVHNRIMLAGPHLENLLISANGKE